MAESGDSCDDSKSKKRRERKYHQFTPENESGDEEIYVEKLEQTPKAPGLQKKSKPSKLFKKPSFSKGIVVSLNSKSTTFTGISVHSTVCRQLYSRLSQPCTTDHKV